MEKQCFRYGTSTCTFLCILSASSSFFPFPPSIFIPQTMTTPIHDSFIRYFCQTLANEIDDWIQVVRPGYRARIVINTKYRLTGIPAESKTPDAGIKIFRAGEADLYPRMVVEVGYSESEAELKNDAWDWLRRSANCVQTVVIVKFCPPRGVETQSPANWQAWLEIWARNPENKSVFFLSKRKYLHTFK